MKGVLTINVLIFMSLLFSLSPVNAMNNDVPNLVGKNGFVVLGDLNSDFYSGKRFDKYKSLPKKPWYVYPVKKTGPNSWGNDTTSKIYHKTSVKVVSQKLGISGSRYGDKFSGTLEVKDIKNGKTYIINYKNFDQIAYWKKNTVEEAMRHGYLIAKFSGNDLPIDKSGKWVEIKKGSLVLVTGKTGTYPKIDWGTYSITAFTYRKWKYGYGGVEIFYKPESLEIVY